MSTPDAPIRRYDVVINDDGYYSIWPDARELPLGWRREGMNGTEEECVAHVEQVWRGLDPKALRERHA